MPLVQAATGAPRSTEWRQGDKVQGNTTLQPGTAIATFDKKGNYEGHAAIYLGQDANGIRVIDQWNNFENQKIISHHTPSERTIYFYSPQRMRVDQGENYYAINK